MIFHTIGNVDGSRNWWYDRVMDIDRGKLLDLLKRRAKYIRGHADTILSGLAMISFIISAFLSGIGNAGVVTKAIVAFTAAGYAAMFVWSLLYNHYSIETLFREICACNNNHRFTLAVIKDRNRFLLKYDKRWRSWLFPYTKADNQESFFDFLRYEVGIEPLEVIKQTEIDVTKESVSAGMTKTYHHTFCQVSFNGRTDRKQYSFAGTKYRWFTIDQMKQNRRIKNTNSETYEYVETRFL